MTESTPSSRSAHQSGRLGKDICGQDGMLGPCALQQPCRTAGAKHRNDIVARFGEPAMDLAADENRWHRSTRSLS